MAAGKQCPCKGKPLDHPWLARFWRMLPQVLHSPALLYLAGKLNEWLAARSERGPLLARQPAPRVLVRPAKNREPAACKAPLAALVANDWRRAAKSFPQLEQIPCGQ